MPGTSFIIHRDVRILFLDYAGVRDTETALHLIDETRRIVAAEVPNRSLLSLTHVLDSHFDTTVLRAMRGLAQHNAPYMKAAAVVGMNPLMKVAFSTVVHLTGRALRAFDDLDEARDFLTTQA
jgi:hypothetical protein